MGYNLLTYGVYWGYNPLALTNLLLTSWDIQAGGHLNKHTQQKPTAQALGGF